MPKAAATAAKNYSEGECSKCGDTRPLVAVSSKLGGRVCDACFVEIKTVGLAFDDYTLQPGELTKEMVADRSQVTLRAVEIWKQKGLLPGRKVRRRIGDGAIKQILVFMSGDVDKFLADRDQAVEIPTIESSGREIEARKPTADLIQAAQLAVVNRLAEAAGLMPSSRRPFMTIDEAAAEYGLSVAGVNHLIADGSLRAFSGPHGRRMVSRRQIEAL